MYGRKVSARTVDMDGALGSRFAAAVAGRNVDALTQLLAPDLDFRGLTPRTFWEASTAKEFVDEILFGEWFTPDERIDALEEVKTATVVDRHHVSYRLRILDRSGTVFGVEQQAYFDVADGRISWLRVLCSGYRPVG
jgi:hypothetical protein